MDGGAQRRREIGARRAVRVAEKDQLADTAMLLETERTHCLNEFVRDERRAEVSGPQRRKKSEGKRPSIAKRIGARVLVKAFHLVEDTLRRLQEHMVGLSRHDTAWRSTEQGVAEPALQIGDAAAQRRLLDPETRSSLGEALQCSRPWRVSQMPQLDAIGWCRAPYAPTHRYQRSSQPAPLPLLMVATADGLASGDATGSRGRS